MRVRLLQDDLLCFMLTREPQTFDSSGPQLAAFSLVLGRTQYSSQALRSWASQRRELDRPWLEMYVPRMETEEGTFLLAHSETAVGGKKYKGKVDVRDSSPLYEKALVKGERSQTQN